MHTPAKGPFAFSARSAIAALVALTAISGTLFTRLVVNNAPEVYFPASAPAVLLEEDLRREFPLDQVLVALFSGDDLLQDESLRAIEALVETLSARSDVERVLAITDVDQIRGVEDGFIVRLLLDFESAASMSLDQRRERVLSDRFAPGALVSRDATALALVLRPVQLEDSIERLVLEEAVRSEIAASPLADRLIGLTGNLPVDVAELRSMIRDTLIFVPATTAIGLLLIWWMFKRGFAVVMTAVAITVVVVSTLSLLVIIDRPMTLVGSIIPPLMTALTIALLMHFFNAIRHASLRGATGERRMLSALSAIRRPAKYTSLTTAAGLASLTVSPISSVNSFGWVTALGTLLSYAIVIWVLPPIVLRFDRGEWAKSTLAGHLVDRFVSRVTRIAIRRWAWVLPCFAAGLALGVPWLWAVEAETDIYAFYRDDHPISIATRATEDRLSGVMSLQIVFRGSGRDSLQSLERLQHMDRFEAWLEQQPEVDRSMSFVDLVEEMHWAFNGEVASFRTLPDDELLINQYLLVYDGRDLYDLVNREFDTAIVATNLNTRGANATGAVMARIESYFRTNEPPPGLRWELAGFGRLFADQEELLITGQVWGLWTAMGMIFLFMLFMWRSPWESVLCMIPNVSPVLLIFILMGAFGVWLDMATALIASVAIGVAVDDTVHIFHGYKTRVGQGLPTVAALMRTYRGVGRACVMTTAILCAEFSILVASNFIPTTQFGWLTAVGLLSALAFDLLLLPAILTGLHYASRLRSRA